MQERKIESQQSRCQSEKNSFRCELLSFNEVLQLSKVLARKIKASGYIPDLIVAVGRGGYVPGRLVSDFLLFSDLTSMKIEHYTRAADILEETRIKFPIPENISGKKILIIDDVTDTGETLKLAVDYVLSLNTTDVRTAVLQHKTCSAFTPDFYAQKILKWRWIIYPWARYEDLAGFAEKILQNRPLDLPQIIAEFKHRYELDLKESELLEILGDLTERGELESIEQNQRKLWSIKQ
ncbi:phosphoribosyltransferase [Methanosarcina sp.]|uniref:phosphoribosyltransferase n=1 Tax=Methanosarcina sp. TaxID=2213 RepID=UPI00298909A2|nr:phosphoribosyltransferase [Methanosarcina sp.]MDW5550862.1 phosphoribosyltransferase [Methanosarcina sp.]MDW5554684.1 phosphoribosyltransferase [Methanosarcina sp.]MDW5560471.1 phosphoribosyltransferase [Methanosarcina sp.]